MRILCSFVWVYLLLMLVAVHSFSDEDERGKVIKSIRTIGIAAVVDGDVSNAFERAKKSALREAVEAGVGVLVSNKTRVLNHTIIEDDVITRSLGYVREYKVIDRQQIDKNTYEVTIEAAVDLENIATDLYSVHLMLEEADNPRIQCRAIEYSLDQSGERTIDKLGILELEISKILNQSGFDHYKDVTTPTMNNQQVDILIEATATIGPSRDTHIPYGQRTLSQLGMFGAIAEIQVSAVWTGNGKKIVQLATIVREIDTIKHIAACKSILTGINELAAPLVEGLAKALRERAFEDRSILMIVQGNYDQQQRLEQILNSKNSTLGIRKLVPRSLDRGVAVYDAMIKTSAFQLMRAISKNGVPGLTMEVLAVSTDRINLKLN